MNRKKRAAKNTVPGLPKAPLQPCNTEFTVTGSGTGTGTNPQSARHVAVINASNDAQDIAEQLCSSNDECCSSAFFVRYGAIRVAPAQKVGSLFRTTATVDEVFKCSRP